MESATRLFSFIVLDYTWYSKVIHDVLMKAPCNGYHCPICKSKGFNSLGICIYSNKDELLPPQSFWMQLC